MRLVGALGVLSVQALLKGAERSLPWDQQRDAFRNSECPCVALAAPRSSLWSQGWFKAAHSPGVQRHGGGAGGYAIR